MSLAPGRELSHYRLVEQIGEGGMGVVWRASDTTLGRDVAIKVLPAAFSSDPERMARFEREARLLASLNHPNIAAVYGVGSAEGVRFLAMEFVAGDDLAQRLLHGPIPVVEALEIARQIAEGLESAHEKGVIHRDLKPANVKVTPDGHVKVLDFGLAKALDSETATGSASAVSMSPTLTSPMTAANVILGTAAYMSPEQARGKAVDRRADIWSFGCVLFECLTGKRAFAGETVSDTLARILERDPELGTLPAATPARVRELLQRCMVKDPKLRMRDIGDARIVLQEVLAARTPSGRLLVGDTVSDTATRRGLPAAALAGIGIAGIAFGAWLWSTFAPRMGGGGAAEAVCVTVPMPEGVKTSVAMLSGDGRTVMVLAQSKNAGDAGRPATMIYTRPLDSFEYKRLPGSDGAVGTCGIFRNVARALVLPSPNSPDAKLIDIPLDGSAPPTAVADWRPTWTYAALCSNGDWVLQNSATSFVRMPSAGGTPSAPVAMDAGRKGVSRFELQSVSLPGDRAGLVNVISYDAGGYHYSVGVVDLATGKVKVIVEDGGSAWYSKAGYLVFARGDAILAAPFDAQRAELRGTPVAIWSGLRTLYTFQPAFFSMSDAGAIFYQPGQAGGDRVIDVLDTAGKLTPWSSEQRAVDSPFLLSPDHRMVACTIVSARGIDEIWISPADHADLRKLGSDPSADCSRFIWSPDSRQLLYWRHGKDGKDGLYVQDVDGGAPRRIFKENSESILHWPSDWTADGSRVLLTVRENGQTHLAVMPFTGAEVDTSQIKTLLPSASEQAYPTIAAGGRLLLFMSLETGSPRAMVAEWHADGSCGRPAQAPFKSVNTAEWSPDGTALYARDATDKLYRTTVTPGTPPTFSPPVEITDLGKLGIQFNTTLPDGRQLVTLKNDNETDITHYNLVLNFMELVRKKLAAAR